MPMNFNSAVYHAGYALSERGREIAMCFWNLAMGRQIGDTPSAGPVLAFSDAMPLISAALANKQPESGELCSTEAKKLIFSFFYAASREGSSSPGSSGDSELASMSKTSLDGLCDQCPFRRPCGPAQTSSLSGEPHCGLHGASSASLSNCIDAGE